VVLVVVVASQPLPPLSLPQLLPWSPLPSWPVLQLPPSLKKCNFERNLAYYTVTFARI
jgi:hypothetical protein